MIQNAVNAANAINVICSIDDQGTTTDVSQTCYTVLDSKQADFVRQELMTMVTHDMRSPLTALHAMMEMFERGAFGELTASGKQKMTRAKEITARLMTMVDQLLDIEKFESKIFDLEIRTIPFQSLMELSVRAVQSVAECREINIEVIRSEESLDCDVNRIERVLVNLLANAIKFSPRATTISVSLRQLPETMEISVTDQGRGVPKEMNQVIFQRFQQIERSDELEHRGSGLGLAVCKALVEAHGGSIGVESLVGVGSRFWFTLPKRISQILVAQNYR